MLTIRLTLIVLVCGLLLGATARAQEVESARPAAADARAEKSASLRGRVLYEGTDEPVRRASVTLVPLTALRPESGRAQHGQVGKISGATDGRGQFAFAEVEAGSYFILVEAQGAVAPSAPGTPSATDERVVRLEAGGSAERTLRVARGGAISGRVSYADGEPATNVRLILYCRDPSGWSRCGAAAVGADDRGHYRFEGLTAGEYVVGASEQHVDVDARNRGQENLFSTAFHPSARTAGEAEPVRVEPGSEAEGTDVVFGDDLRVVAGRVTWKKDGLPAAGAGVRLRRPAPETAAPSYTPQLGSFDDLASFYALGRAPSPSDRTTFTDEDGRFAFTSVPDGEYVLSAQKPLDAGRTHLDAIPRLSAQKTLSVRLDGADAAALALVLSDGSRVSGHVLFEGAREGDFASLVLRSADPSDPRQYTEMIAGGDFSIEGIGGGEFFIDVLPLGLEGVTRYVRSVTGPDGADLTRAPIRVGEDGSYDGVRIVLADDGAAVTGLVRTPSGLPPDGLLVFLVPADPSLWGVSARQTYARPGPDGSFAANCPPGAYLLIAAPEAAARAPVADLVRSYGAGAARLSLRPRERREVEVAAPDVK